MIKDLGSVNGTILQGNILAPYKEYPLRMETHLHLRNLFTLIGRLDKA